MSRIFDDIFRNLHDLKIKLCSVAAEKRVLLKITCFCLVSITALIITVISTGVTFGYTVKYDGEEIAIVEKASVFDKAVTLARSAVNADNVDITVKKPKFRFTLTVSSRMLDAQNLADVIIDKTDNIVSASALIVNGNTVSKVENFDAQTYVDERLSKFNIDGAENFSAFVDDVDIVTGYYLASDVNNLTDFIAAVDSLQVRTYSTVTTDSEIPYSTEKQKTDTQLIGYSATTVEGKNGIQRKTEKVVMINGLEQERTEISSVTVSQPVNEVITVGTAKSTATASQRKAAASAGFVFPLPKGKWAVSAYYGDGRSHKGVDLAAEKGVSIFAVKSGKVISAGFDGGYGYTVVIDHGNGMKTRYAHASKLLVSVGETVNRGEVIAQVGCTGNATGNHLHFEVLINNSYVDPAPYLGIG